MTRVQRLLELACHTQGVCRSAGQAGDESRMVVNFKAARALGVTLPLALLGRADQVLE